MAKFQESAIEYYKSADGGSTYTVLVTDNNDLKKPGKYLAQLDYVSGKNYLVTHFSVVDNRKQDPKYEKTNSQARSDLQRRGADTHQRGARRGRPNAV